MPLNPDSPLRRASGPGSTLLCVCAAALFGCGSDDPTPPDDGGSDEVSPDTSSGEDAMGLDGAIDGGGLERPCPSPEVADPSGTDRWEDGLGDATVVVEDREMCLRRFTLSTTASLRHGEPTNPRTFSERDGWPTVRSGHDMFDALHALGLGPGGRGPAHGGRVPSHGTRSRRSASPSCGTIMTEPHTFRPDWVSPPGETIEDLLAERGWTHAELAERTGFTRKHVNDLVKGPATMTPDTASRLATAIGGPVAFWLTREAQYRAAVERRRGMST